MAGRRRRAGRATLAAALLLGAPAGTAGAASAAASPPQRIIVGSGLCAAQWTAPNPGRARFRLRNATARAAAVTLVHPRNGRRVAGPFHLLPRQRRTVTVRLGAGLLAWSCAVRGLPVATSPVGRVPADPVLSPPVGPPALPINLGELTAPLAAYRAYAEGQLAETVRGVGALQAALAAGDVPGAREAWLVAHLSWRRIGAAYGALGATGTAIDTTTAGLDGGTSDPAFTGFHRVEFDLWRSGDLAAAQADTAVLARSLAALAAGFPTRPLPRTDLPLRAHEILEDALRDELTGNDDAGSGTSLAAVTADVDATRAVLGVLVGLLAPRAPTLVARVSAQLDVLDAALLATRVDGTWVAVAAVPLAQRQRVDAAIGAALETLAPVPDLLTTGTT